MQQIISQQKNSAFYDTAAQKTCNYLNPTFLKITTIIIISAGFLTSSSSTERAFLHSNSNNVTFLTSPKSVYPKSYRGCFIFGVALYLFWPALISWYLDVQSQQRKYKKIVWICSKLTIKTSLTSFWCLYS